MVSLYHTEKMLTMAAVGLSAFPFGYSHAMLMPAEDLKRALHDAMTICLSAQAVAVASALPCAVPLRKGRNFLGHRSVPHQPYSGPCTTHNVHATGACMALGIGIVMMQLQVNPIDTGYTPVMP